MGLKKKYINLFNFRGTPLINILRCFNLRTISIFRKKRTKRNFSVMFFLIDFLYSNPLINNPGVKKSKFSLERK